MAEDSGGNEVVTKVAVTVAALAAAFVAQRAVNLAWRTVTGSSGVHDDDSPLPEVMLFAALSAGTIAVARTWASRKAKAYLARSTSAA